MSRPWWREETHGLLLLIYMGKDERHLQTNHIHRRWRCSSHRNAGDSRWRWELKLRNATLKKSRTRSSKIFWLLADVFLQTCWLFMRIWQTCWVIWCCLCFAPHSHRKGNKLEGTVNLVWNIRHLQVSFPWILLFIHHPPIFQTVRATTTINITQQCGQVSHPQASGFQTGYMMHPCFLSKMSRGRISALRKVTSSCSTEGSGVVSGNPVPSRAGFLCDILKNMAAWRRRRTAWV